MKYTSYQCEWCYKIGCEIRLPLEHNGKYQEYAHFCSYIHFKKYCKLMIKGGVQLA